MKVLVIGPSDTRSRGGMAAVIAGIRNSVSLNSKFDIDIFPSYIDGNILLRFMYSAYGYIRFLACFQKYDLFHIHTASFGSIFRKKIYLDTIRRAGKKAIVHIHGAQFLVFYEGLKDRKKQKVVDFLNSADMVLALSDDWKEKFEDIFHIENCRTLNNGIDTEEFASAVTQPEAFKNSFLLLGRLGVRKGAYDLVNAVETAVRQNPHIKVYMAGDGEVDKVRMLVREKGLDGHIDVTGWIGFEEKIKLLKKVSTVVLPSYNEGMPMSILEGMACGKAIISTTAGAIPEVVKAENGILITPGDIRALAEALVRCSTDTDLIRKMSEHNIRLIEEQFSMKRMHEKLGDYYYLVCGGG